MVVSAEVNLVLVRGPDLVGKFLDRAVSERFWLTSLLYRK